MVKITSVHGVTDGGRNFATMAVPEVESGLEKDALHLVADEKGQKTTMFLKINKKVTNDRPSKRRFYY